MACSLDCPSINGGVCVRDSLCQDLEYSSAAAEILALWTLCPPSSACVYDETYGEVGRGTGWYALYRRHRAVLRNGSADRDLTPGSYRGRRWITAWQVPAECDLDEAWGRIMSGAVSVYA